MPQNVPYNIAMQTEFPTSPAIPPRAMNIQRFNQIVRLAFQVSGTNFADAAEIAAKANWDTLIAATDDTRIILSPPFSNSKITQSKLIETSADTNETYLGLPIYFGEGTTMFSCTFNDVDAAVLDALVQVVSPMSQSNGIGPATLVAYMCNKDGHIFHTPSFGGFPCINFSVRTRGSDGLNTSDKNDACFYMPPGWDGGATMPVPTVPTGVGAVDLRAYPW